MEAPLSSPMALLLAPVTAIHPPELETDDASLATEVLPAPPPLVSVSGQRRDTHLKRPSQVFSYLPASDPGSTYSGLMGGLGLSLVPEDEGRLRKRPRVDKTAINNRAQRASARNISPSAVPDLPSPPEPNPSTDVAKQRDKGKAREKPPLRVKEEFPAVSLDMLELSGLHPNDDHCSSCRSHGALVYCDGCPRAFHLWCLDPPLDAQDIPENRWYCPACVIRQNPPPKPRRSLFSPLLHQLQTSIPTEFELPEDIRAYFKDVVTGPKGAYQDSSETKVVRSSRFILQEERDPFRLKDRNGLPILCFRCGKSALPDGDATTAPSAPASSSSSSSSLQETHGSHRILQAVAGEVMWRSIVSCDHCSLHWHLDCLEPPLASMPPPHKKWMCPTHIEHIAPKRRVPRQVPPVTDITERNRPNNGNVEIIPADNGLDEVRKMAVDEVHINGRRYRVPERVIILDFWDKLTRGHNPPPTHGLLSGLSSPLTSLSSLEDIELFAAPPDPCVESESPLSREPDPETMQAVKLLFGCRNAVVHSRDDRMDVSPSLPAKTDAAVQTELEDLDNAKQTNDPKFHDPDHPKNPVPRRSLPRTRPTAKKFLRTQGTPVANGLTEDPLTPQHIPGRGSARITRSKSISAVASTPASSRVQRKTTELPLTRSSSRISSNTRSPIEANKASSLNENRKSPTSVLPRVSWKMETTPTEATNSPDLAAIPPNSEPSTSTLPQAPISNKSPFKIRIPRAINTAVAAATAAAAATSSAPLSSPSTGHKRTKNEGRDLSLSPESDAADPSVALGDDSRIPTNESPTEGITRSNGRLRDLPRDGASPARSRVNPDRARVTRSTHANARASSRPLREVSALDRSSHNTDITTDSSSDFVPPRQIKVQHRRYVNR